jgi:hypothetical protein
MTKNRQFDNLDPKLLEAMECERQFQQNVEKLRTFTRLMAEGSEKFLYQAADAKSRAGFIPSQIAAWLRAAANRIEERGVGDPPTEWDPSPW